MEKKPMGTKIKEGITNAFKVFSSNWGTLSAQALQNPFYTEGCNNGEKWLDFGVPGDMTIKVTDTYPDYLYSLYSRSIQHAKLIDIKSDMTFGGGWENIPADVMSNKFGGADLNTILRQDSFEENLIGAFALLIHWDERSMADPTYAKPAYIKKIPIQNVRLGNPYTDKGKYKDKLYVCENWAGRNRGGIGTEVKEFHKFSLNIEDIRQHPQQIYYAPFRKMGSGNYGIPPYGTQTDVFEIDFEIPKFHLTGLKIGAFGTLHIHNSNGIPSEEIMDQDTLEFNQLYMGTQGARIYRTYSDGEDRKVTFENIDLGISDQKFLELWNKNTETIFKAHGVDMKLLGADKGGLSIGRDDLLEVIEKTQVQVINGIQQAIEKVYREIYSKSGLNIDWKIKKYEINLRKVKTTTQDIMLILASQVSNAVKLELLKDAGVENAERYLAGAPEVVPQLPAAQPGQPVAASEQGSISAWAHLSAKQQQGMDRVKRKYDKGSYTQQQAVLLLTGFGLTTEQAMEWLGVE